LTLGIPTSPGVTKGNAADTLTADYNDIESVKRLFSSNKNQIAAIIIEAVAGNMGVVRSTDKFIKDLFEICREEKAVIIFDEVMTGFRVAKGGAQELYGVKPDLSTFGKIIGGGLPVGAFGGKKEIMEMIAPAGPVYQAGTLSGNPLAISAGLAALNFIKENPGIYKKMEKKSSYLAEGFNENMRKLKRKFILNRVGSMFTLFFTEEEVNGFNSAVKADTELFGKYFNEMLKRGIYLPPSQFEAVFISAAHSTKDLDKTISANYDSLKALSFQS
jgi:glutamate-1-semialdehyde 2,1-aminomutase